MDSDHRVLALATALEQIKPGRRAALRALFAGAAALFALPVLTVEADAAGRGRGKGKKRKGGGKGKGKRK